MKSLIMIYILFAIFGIEAFVIGYDFASETIKKMNALETNREVKK